MKTPKGNKPVQEDALLATGVQFLTQTTFSELVKATASDGNITHLEAVLVVCDERKVEYETVRGLLTKDLKTILTAEALKSNLLKK